MRRTSNAYLYIFVLVLLLVFTANVMHYRQSQSWLEYHDILQDRAALVAPYEEISALQERIVRLKHELRDCGQSTDTSVLPLRLDNVRQTKHQPTIQKSETRPRQTAVNNTKAALKPPTFTLPNKFAFNTNTVHDVELDIPSINNNDEIISSVEYNYTIPTNIVLDKSSNNHKFAYAFVISGCDTQTKRYQRYLYNALVVTKKLRETGSTADVIIFFQLLHNSKHETILDEDVRWMTAMNITYHGIPKRPDTTFYTANMDKFRILQLEQYDRVLFLDNDVMLRTNTDYLFHLSIQGVLKENIVISGVNEPSNAGFFMLAPKRCEWRRILQVIAATEARGRNMSYPHWDVVKGWGEPIGEYEYAEGKKGHYWRFMACFADQGLLYYWTKFIKQSVSVFLYNRIENWGSDSNGRPVLERTMPLDILEPWSDTAPNCWVGQLHKSDKCWPPRSHYMHFTGNAKPWLNNGPLVLQTGVNDKKEAARLAWWQALREIDEEIGMGMSYSKPKKKDKAKLGMFARYSQLADSHYGEIMLNEEVSQECSATAVTIRRS